MEVSHRVRCCVSAFFRKYGHVASLRRATTFVYFTVCACQSSRPPHPLSSRTPGFVNFTEGTRLVLCFFCKKGYTNKFQLLHINLKVECSSKKECAYSIFSLSQSCNIKGIWLYEYGVTKIDLYIYIYKQMKLSILTHIFCSKNSCSKGCLSSYMQKRSKVMLN